MSQTLESPPPRGRLVLGCTILAVGFLCPLAVPLVTSSDLSGVWKTTLTGALLAGIPELFTLVAAAVLGKSGFEYLKGKVFGFLKRHGPAERVSRARYRVGLVMFVLPLVHGWVTPYARGHVPGFDVIPWWVGLAGDAVLIASLFVLGGEFWDKLRALFVYEAEVRLPQKT